MNAYLYDPIELEHGSVDDTGEMSYGGLFQNVPDGYVTDLQVDLYSLGFTAIGKSDGAFGNKTEEAVRAFQLYCKLENTGIVDASTKDEIVIWISQGRHKDEVIEPELDKAKDGVLHLISPRVVHFSQGDSRWASRVLGRSSSIRSQGCAIACIAMILRHFGRDINPGKLDEYLDTHSGYSGNSVKWNVAGKCGETAKNKLKFKQKTGNTKSLKRVLLQRIEKNLPTMVRVDYGKDEGLTYNHFVIAVGITADEEIVMLDPGTRHGDGYADLKANIIERTSRKGGYQIVQLDWFEEA